MRGKPRLRVPITEETLVRENEIKVMLTEVAAVVLWIPNEKCGRGLSQPLSITLGNTLG